MKTTDGNRKGKTNGGTELPETNDKMAIGNLHISIITLSANGLNSPIKKAQGSRLEQKPNQTMYYLQETTYTLQRQK